MSIEEKLTEEFQHHSSYVTIPASVNSRITSMYREHFQEKKVGKRSRIFFKKGIIIALLIVILSGFTYGGTLLFQEKKGNISMSLTSSKEYSLDNAALKKVRGSLKDIYNQLHSGEVAVVYFSGLDKKYGFFEKYPLLSVAKPKVITQEQAWKQELIRQHIQVKVPKVILGTYHFAGGMKGVPFAAYIDVKTLSLKGEMREESTNTGKDVVWRKISNSQPVIQSYTMIYQDAHQNKIYYTLQLTDEKIKMKRTVAGSTAYDALSINGNNASYVRNDQFLYGNSNVYQSIMWLTTQGDRTLMKEVSTDSIKITKQQLIDAADSLVRNR